MTEETKMESRFTFSQKLAGGFAVMVLLALAVAAVAVIALRDVVASKDEVINVDARRMTLAERLNALSFRKANDARAYLMTKDAGYLEALRATRKEMRDLIETLRSEVQTDGERALVKAVDEAEDVHNRAVEAVIARSGGASIEAAGLWIEKEVRPLRDQLNRSIDRFLAAEQRHLDEGRQAATDSASRAARVVIALAALATLLAVSLAYFLARTLSRQISTAVRHVQSSSSELQAAAGQQATGAKEQATAMSEITTTISELLATSRQISESAQRVASIAAETASAARVGDETVQRSQEIVGSIRRQVDLIVSHMLELGRKSQQIGGVVDVVSELAEQTNILAINATIEAAGAGEAGKRFAAVAEEIRKLADRVGGSTKDIRLLVDEVRSAVNTTVMATESGSKAVEAGARQSAEVASAFAHIAGLVGTTTEAAREIELSTKQQSTAVEQVNLAIANVAQATRESEASSGQTLQTASQLASMSRDLAQLVQPAAAA
jgi:methyl-accepting chemotaxis protein